MSVWIKPWSETIQTIATEQYFFVGAVKGGSNFLFSTNIWSNSSVNIQIRAILPSGAVYYAVQVGQF